MQSNLSKSEKPVASGILCIDKPPGMTSHDVVNRLRKLYNTKKVGHTGTLDPMATGLLIVLIGSAVKASEFLMSSNKQYIAGLRLGLTSDTEDISGNILTKTEKVPSKEEVFTVCREHFVGDIMQIPPMYSALKINGRKLVDIARNGETVEREPRPVTVHSLDVKCENEESGDYILDVNCSKGTYIRTLCADIGAKLSCGGLMSSLKRSRNGAFSLSDAHTLSELENLDMAERASLLIPLDSAFSDYTRIDLPDFYAKLVRNGVKLYASKLPIKTEIGENLRLYDKNKFFALAKTSQNSEGEMIIRVLKQFL